MRAWSEGGRLVLHLEREAGGGKRGRSQNECRMAQPQVLLASVLALAVLDLGRVSAVQVYTPREITVSNGTEARLQCTFRSTEVISSAASVTWSFQAEGSPSVESFFYYSNGKAYPGKEIPFKDKIHWAGDLNKKDASISIANIQFRDNGTYICDVKNPPDIIVFPGEIRLRVVERDTVAPRQIAEASSTPIPAPEGPQEEGRDLPEAVEGEEAVLDQTASHPSSGHVSPVQEAEEQQMGEQAVAATLLKDLLQAIKGLQEHTVSALRAQNERLASQERWKRSVMRQLQELSSQQRELVSRLQQLESQRDNN
ncbi:uncharacterized protein LOC143831515 isoform X2 [Paroedura picta]|uniref:uncharacterized protein LOC143831515 isoform X2 n=1 Tax=Paroedura picta TaxID=143630 RepID=UPI0040570A1B